MKKKVVLMALVLVASASFNVAGAAQKKKKVQKTTVKIEPVRLNTASDSLSYAAGMVRTEGLLPFLKQQYGVDEASLSYVIDGFKATMAQGTDTKAKAYAAGQQIGYMVMERMLPYLKDEFKGTSDSISSAMFTEGFVNSLRKNDSIMADSTAREYFDATFKAAVNKRNEANRKAGEDFLAANAKKEGVVTLPSGLQYKVITKGTGEVPGIEDEVTVKYEGRLIDGTVFDSSYKRPGETSKFRPNQVIKGWTEALTMMPVGSKWELYIPQNLAYGERKAGQIQPYSALIFTVEMVKVEKKEASQADAKAAPAAKATAAKTAKKAVKAAKK